MRDQALATWLQQVADAINGLPAMSFISTTDGPNASNYSGDYGSIVVDVNSSSTTVYWVKRTSNTTTQGWEPMK